MGNISAFLAFPYCSTLSSFGKLKMWNLRNFLIKSWIDCCDTDSF